MLMMGGLTEDSIAILHVYSMSIMCLYTGSFVSSRSLTNIYTYSTKEVLAVGFPPFIIHWCIISGGKLIHRSLISGGKLISPPVDIRCYFYIGLNKR